MKIILLLISLIISSPAFSCSCGLYTDESDFRLSESVFVAKSINLYLHDSNGDGKNQTIRSGFEIIRVFKGNPKKIQYLEGYTYSINMNKGCPGVFLYPGEYYLLYVENPNTPFLGSCSSSRKIDEKDIESIEPYKGFNR